MTKYVIPTVAELKEKTNNGNHKFEVVSLFAGGGGSSLGYRMAGGKVLAVNEFVEEAIKTYKANWPDTLILPNDIRHLSGKDILQAIGKNKGELDLMDGSPPCSAFSSAGKREKGWGKEKKYSDTTQKNVEDLFFEYIRVLTDIQPKVFVAENVSGLAKGAAKGYLKEIIKELKNAGYYVECKILDAQWLGVPQKRARTIFVGVRNDLFTPNMKGKLHPVPNKNKVNLLTAFEGLTFTDQDKKETDIKKYSIYPYLKSLAYGTSHKKRFSLAKCDPLDTAYCITATNGNIGAAKSSHWDNRAFTISELKRIMSVPDDYCLTGDYSKKAERLGRMVAPLMMKAVAENIIKIGAL